MFVNISKKDFFLIFAWSVSLLCSKWDKIKRKCPKPKLTDLWIIGVFWLQIRNLHAWFSTNNGEISAKMVLKISQLWRHVIYDVMEYFFEFHKNEKTIHHSQALQTLFSTMQIGWKSQVNITRQQLLKYLRTLSPTVTSSFTWIRNFSKMAHYLKCLKLILIAYSNNKKLELGTCLDG